MAPELTRLRRASGDPVGAYSGIGTFGEHQVVARSAAIRVDPGTPPEIAALIGCAVATGIGAATRTAQVKAGESVVVIGLGGVGLSAVMGAAAAGADPITAIDISPEKLELARAAGAHRTLLAPEAARAGGADHVLECIGLVEMVETAIALARPGGVITLVGMTPQGARASFDVYRFVEDGKVIRGSNYGSAVPERDFPAIAADYLAGRLPLDLLVTERIRLEGLDGAFAAMRRGDGARRVIVHGRGDGTPPAMDLGMSDARQSPIPQDRFNENTDMAQRAADDRRQAAEQERHLEDAGVDERPGADPKDQPGMPDAPTSPADGGD